MKPSEKQVGLLGYVIRSQFKDMLPKIMEGGADRRIQYLEERGAEQDKYEISSFINVMNDDDLDHEFRMQFGSEWLRQKGYEHI